MRNDFLDTLQNIALESAGIEAPAIDKYASNPCAEEFMALDDFDNAMIANESFASAALESIFENQLVALESAGLNGMEDIDKFSGELSTEAVVNAVKRGAYNVKIQVKKALSKIWSLIMSIVTMFTGSEGRLKSYGKLCKKYREKLAKVSPKIKEGKDEKEVTIRKWDKLKNQISSFKTMADTNTLKSVKEAVQAVDTKDLSQVVSKILSVADNLGNALGKVDGKSLMPDIKSGSKLKSAADLQAIEKDLEDSIRDSSFKSDLEDVVKEIKEVETEDYSITSAQSTMLNWLSGVETECNSDVKFKKELDSINKSWKKKFGDFELTDAANSDQVAAAVRIMNKVGTLIGYIRTALTKHYGAVASNIQGLLADAAKVIAKGTNIGA